MSPGNNKSRPIPLLCEAPPLPGEEDLDDDFNWDDIVSDDENDNPTQNPSTPNKSNHEDPVKVTTNKSPRNTKSIESEQTTPEKKIVQDKQPVSNQDNQTKRNGSDFRKNREKKKKKSAQRLHCEICDIYVNGQATMDSHIKGQKHKSKQRQVDLQEENDKISRHLRNNDPPSVPSVVPPPTTPQNQNGRKSQTSHVPSSTANIASSSTTPPSQYRPPQRVEVDLSKTSKHSSSAPPASLGVSTSPVPIRRSALSTPKSDSSDIGKLNRDRSDNRREQEKSPRKITSFPTNPKTGSPAPPQSKHIRKSVEVDEFQQQKPNVPPFKKLRSEKIDKTPSRDSPNPPNSSTVHRAPEPVKTNLHSRQLSSRPKEQVMAGSRYTGLRSEARPSSSMDSAVNGRKLSSTSTGAHRYEGKNTHTLERRNSSSKAAPSHVTASGSMSHKRPIEDNKSRTREDVRRHGQSRPSENYNIPTPKPYIIRDRSIPAWSIGQPIREERMREDAPLVPKDILEAKMTLPELRELRQHVFSYGSDVDRLAYKMMQELLISPVAGVGSHWLKPFSDVMMESVGRQHFNPHTGGFYVAKSIPRELHDPRRSNADEENNYKPGSEQEKQAAVRKIADNIAFSFFVEEDIPDSLVHVNREEVPYRGTIGKRQLSHDPNVYTGNYVNSKYSDFVPNDVLFQRIFERIRMSTYNNPG